MAIHFWSLLPIEDPGLVMHFLKHLSVTFCNSSCMLAKATCCCTVCIISSFWEGDRLASWLGSMMVVKLNSLVEVNQAIL